MDLSLFIERYFPFFITAGDYLLKVQSSVQSIPKEGKSIFTFSGGIQRLYRA